MIKEELVETLLYFGLGVAIGVLIVKLLELIIKTFKQEQ
jgi:capsular polysaccharide biosynthesis protein